MGFLKSVAGEISISVRERVSLKPKEKQKQDFRSTGKQVKRIKARPMEIEKEPHGLDIPLLPPSAKGMGTDQESTYRQT